MTENNFRQENAKSMKTLTLDKQNFDQTTAGKNTPVLVDFWAEWCGPCKMIAPALKEIAAEQAGQAVVGKVNIDESPELAARFGVTGIPTLIVFKNGRRVTTLRGAQSKATILRSLAAARPDIQPAKYYESASAPAPVH
jgi:thioredoxin 1